MKLNGPSDRSQQMLGLKFNQRQSALQKLKTNLK